MEIKKGMKFLCIKDVVMDSGAVTYREGDIYTSEKDGCITNMQNDNGHKWEEYADEYLKKIEEDAMNYDSEEEVVLCDFERDFLNKEQPLSLKDKYVLCPTKEDAKNVIKWLDKKGLNNCGATAGSWDKYGQSMYIYLDGGEYGDFEYLRGDITLLLPHQFNKMIGGKELLVEQPEQPEPSVKNDFKDGKLRWDLLPLELVEELVKVYHYGAEKYYPESWKEIPNGYQRLKAASLRHLVAFEKGETIDAESGLPHLICASWNLLTCYYYANKNNVNETK